MGSRAPARLDATPAVGGRPPAWGARCRAVLAVVLLGLAPLLAGRAAAEPPALTLAPRWAPGEQHRLRIETVRDQARGQGRGERVATRAEVSLEVVEASSGGFLVRWTFGTVSVEDSNPQRAGITRELAGLARGMRYELDLEPSGALRGVRNWTELKTLGEAAVARVLERLRQLGMREPALAALQHQVRGMFASEQDILAHAVPEAALFHAPLGRHYRLGEGVAYEGLLPNPFGGEPIPSRGEFLLRGLEQPPGRATITWRQTLDAEATTRIVRQTVADLAARAGQPPPPEGALPAVAVQDAAEFLVDGATGWPEIVTHTRTVRAGHVERVERTTITRLAPPAR